jgi:WD40 repeat protein
MKNVRHRSLPMTRVLLGVAVGVLFLMGPHAYGGQGKKDKPEEPKDVSYYKKIRPIFQQNCQGCHQPAKASGGLVMLTYADLLKKGDSGQFAIVPGQPGKSHLIDQVTAHNGKKAAMPPKGDPLSDADIKLLKAWIAEGAKDDTPMTARTLVDPEHPPQYNLPPVITALAYSPDSTLLAVSGYHEILIHKADGSGLVARLVGLSERISSLAFSPDGKLLAATGGSPGRFGEVQIWDVRQKRLKLSLPVTYDTVYGVRWSHDGRLVSFGCSDNSLRAIEADGGKQVFFNGGHNDWVLDTVFSKDDSHLMSVSRDMSMKLSEVKTSRLIDNITSITPGALKGGLISVDGHPTRNEVVTGGSDGSPKTYQIYRTKDRKIGDDFNLVRKFADMPGRIYCVRYNKNGSRFVAGSSFEGKGEARVYQTVDPKLPGGRSTLMFLLPSLFGQPTALAVDTCPAQVKLAGEKGPVFAVAFRPDGRQVASAGFDGVVRLNDSNTGALLREFVPCPVQTASAK